MTNFPQKLRTLALPDGRKVEVWRLAGAGGLEIECLTFGGIVSALRVPGPDGGTTDVVLGFADPAAYADPHPYLGAIVGRLAGRVSNACMVVGGRKFDLSANQAPLHLHGGFSGFDKQIWQAGPLAADSGCCALQLSYLSPDGEEGCPGEVRVAVTYTVTADNRFVIETRADASMPTPVNLTHHGYFHLGGEGEGDALDHELEICSGFFAPVEDSLRLCGRLEPVSACNDFRRPRLLREAVPGLFKCHGDIYRLEPSTGPAARLFHPASGRCMEVWTDSSFLQFYTGMGLDGSLRGKSGRPYPRFGGICLEAEGYPDAPNCPELDDVTVYPGQPQRRTTCYAFSTRQPGHG